MPADVLLLAGLLCDERIWRDVADRLGGAAATVRIVCFEGMNSIGRMADHVLSVAPPRAVIVGHSMGGRVALEVHARAPRRVCALGLFNTGTHPPAPGEAESRGRLVALAREAGMAALAAVWLPPMMDADGPADPALTHVLAAMVASASPRSFEGQVRALLKRPDADAALAAVDVPVLLLSGTGDRWSPVAQHERMRARLRDAELAVIERAGHMAPAERPDAVADVLRGWLGRLNRAGARQPAMDSPT